MIRRLSFAFFVLALPSIAAAEEPETWYPAESPTGVDLLNIDFSPDGTGFIVGAGGTVLRYDGKVFQVVPGPGEPISFAYVAAVGPDELWAIAGGSGVLYHFQRGRWTKDQLGADFDAQSIAFLNPRLGYAAGLFGALYRYDGERWERVVTPVLSNDRESHLEGIALFAPDDVWIGGYMGFVLHFDGRSWQRLTPRNTADGCSLSRLGDTVALISPPALIKRGGDFVPLSPAGARRIAESKGSIWGTDDNGNLVHLEPSKSSLFRPPRPVASIASGPDGLWAVGRRGLILHKERGGLPSFEDQTFEAGVGVLSESGMALSADLDGNGKSDILLAPFGKYSFLRAEGGLSFRSQPLSAPPLEALPDAHAIAIADMDGDGLVDLLLRPQGREGAPPWQLLRNLGFYRFISAGPSVKPLLPEDVSPHGDLDVADFDGDGDLDVYEVRASREPSGQTVPNVLYLNDGLGRFSTKELAHHDGGASLAWSEGVLSADFTGDGRTDLLSVNAWGEGNTFFRQTSEGALVDDTQASGLAGAVQHGLSAEAGDIDGDGSLDVLVLAYYAYGPTRLYRNDGRGHFRDVTSASGIADIFSAARRAVFADMDLDGDLDLVVCHVWPRDPSGGGTPPSKLLLNDGKGFFTDVTGKTGAGLPALDLLVGDFDDDGDNDIYFVQPQESNRLLVNNAPPGRWLKVSPRSPPPNRAALGARVSVYGPGGALLGIRETNHRQPIAHFGLGSADQVTVEVRFPSGRVWRREGVKWGQTIEAVETSFPFSWASEAAYFLRHRVAWMDPRREALRSLFALVFVLFLWRIGPRLGGRRISPRAGVAALLFLMYGALEVASMPLAPVSFMADALPLSATVLLGLSVFLLDRAVTRRIEARYIGHYEILGLLGQGGMGIVYKARDMALPERSTVALKVLRPERVGDPASLRRFVREADVGARLSHPGIVRVLGSGECRILAGRRLQTTAYIAMEYIDGISLSTLLSGGERLPVQRAIEIVRDAALALASAHAAGVLHRDIKPDNLLLSRGGVVKIVDFGIAAITRASDFTDAGLIVGTLAYLPPERLAGRKEDARGDLYALGAVLYEAACGRRPFDGTRDTAALLRAIATEAPLPPCSLRAEIGPRLSALILALLAKDPSQRPGSAREVADALSMTLRELAGEVVEGPALVAPAMISQEVPRPQRIGEPELERVTLELPAAELPRPP